MACTAKMALSIGLTTILVIVVLVATLVPTFGSKSDRKTGVGDNCTTLQNGPGICTRLLECPAFDPEKIQGIAISKTFSHCYFEGSTTSIICCPEVDMTTTTTTTAKSISGRTNSGKRKSEEACDNYINTLGRLPELITTNIFAGVEAREGEFPHMAALGNYVYDNLIRWTCSGVILTETHILTAAHCIITLDDIIPNVARVGALRMSTAVPEASDYDIPNNTITVHPQYVRPRRYNDFAIIR